MTVTVGVKCFNNVRYIREALERAFRQTYRPLEIVVCDDCSTDGSWERICGLATGDYIVKFDGDDVSEPLLFVYAVVRYLRRRLSGLCTAKFKSC